MLGIEKLKAITVDSIDGLRPARGFLLVKPHLRSEVSAGGIIIPEAKKERDKPVMESGSVTAVGLPARKGAVLFPWPQELRESSTVYYTRTAGTEIKTSEGLFLLILHNELLMIE